MDLQQFYDEDPRRRRSEELEFGRDWNDDGGRYEVSWVEDTGEVYAMSEPSGGIVTDPIGDNIVTNVSEHQLIVTILGLVPGRDAIAAVMHGWEDAMSGGAGLEWVRRRIAAAESLRGEPPAHPSYDLPPD